MGLKNNKKKNKIKPHSYTHRDTKLQTESASKVGQNSDD